jgi:hypothetical protein
MKTQNQLSCEAIDEFKAIYQQEFGVDEDEWLEWAGGKRK